MGAKKYFTDLDLNQNQIKNVVLEKIQESTDFEASINKKAGRIVFDNTNTGMEDSNGDYIFNNEIKYFDGTDWQLVSGRFDGQIFYKGKLKGSDLLNINPEVGDLYVFMTESLNPTLGKRVFSGDMVICRAAYGPDSIWEIIKGNVVEASEINKGLVKFFDPYLSPMASDKDVITVFNFRNFGEAEECWYGLNNNQYIPIDFFNRGDIYETIVPVVKLISKSKVYIKNIDKNPLIIDILDAYFGTTMFPRPHVIMDLPEILADFKVYNNGQEIEVEIQKIGKSKYAFTSSELIADAKIVVHMYVETIYHIFTPIMGGSGGSEDESEYIDINDMSDMSDMG
jgi:hypothetical protein